MKKTFLLFCCAAILLAACATTPAGSARRNRQPSALPPTATLTPLPVPSDTVLPPTALPTLTPTATFGVGSSLTLARDAVCRKGPGESYYEVMPFFEKDTPNLQGRNETGDWVMVKDAFGIAPACWIPAAALAPVAGLDGVPVAEYPALPAAPTSITAPKNVCGITSWPVVVKWSPVVSGAQYRLYRNGKLISTQSGGSYNDMDMPKPHTPAFYTYLVQAFNDYGDSPHTLTVSVSVCGKQ
ncbi:MAG: hypothetical protein WA821_15645 [Anaerolineales bacterium]